MTGVDCHEDMSKELGVDKQIGEEPALLGFWHTSFALVVSPATRKHLAQSTSTVSTPPEMVPVGGVEVEAVEHAAVVPGEVLLILAVKVRIISQYLSL